MKYQYIVFDIDGTLIDTEYAVLHSLQDLVRELSGREIPLSDLTFALGITGEDALKRLDIIDIPHANIMELWDKNMRKYTDSMMVFDGITELLTYLSERGCEMGIVTSRTREEFEQDACMSAISGFFKTIICADDTQQHKPKGAPLLKCMELSGTDCGKVLYVGDSVYDGMCAESAGTDFALAVWGSHRTDIKADYYLQKPDDLMDIIF